MVTKSKSQIRQQISLEKKQKKQLTIDSQTACQKRKSAQGNKSFRLCPNMSVVGFNDVLVGRTFPLEIDQNNSINKHFDPEAL